MSPDHHILVCATIFCLASNSAFATENCEETTGFTIQPVAQYVDEGFRPLSNDEVDEIYSQQDGSPDGWRPKSSNSDCEKQSSSMLEPEERGYRPLDYGTTEQGADQPADAQQQLPDYRDNRYWWNSQQSQGSGYMPGYGGQGGYGGYGGYGAYGGYGYPNYSPVYPSAPGNSWYQGNTWPQGGYGGNPYYSMPQFMPGYGAMPFGFGGSGLPW